MTWTRSARRSTPRTLTDTTGYIKVYDPEDATIEYVQLVEPATEKLPAHYQDIPPFGSTARCFKDVMEKLKTHFDCALTVAGIYTGTD